MHLDTIRHMHLDTSRHMQLDTVRHAFGHTLSGVNMCVDTLEEDELAKLLESLWKQQNGGKMPGDVRVRMVEDVRKSMTQFDTTNTGSLTFEQFLRLVQVPSQHSLRIPAT